MLFERRMEKILELLAAKKTVTIQEMVSYVNVSESTIRRDLISLEEKNLLRRIHGGATTVNEIGREEKMAQKVTVNQHTKHEIAKYAVSMIKPDSHIYVDAGTATLELIQMIPNNLNIHVVTNGVDHALTAIQRELPVTILGGNIKPNTHAIADLTAYQQLEKMNFSYAFLGMNGLHEASGLTTTNLDEARIKELAMNQSQHIRILMDESKVGKIYEHTVDAPSQAIILLDKKAQTTQAEQIKKLNKRYDLHFV